MNIPAEQIKKSWKFLILLFVLGGLFGSYPYTLARIEAGNNWQGVVPEVTGDSLYYMTRANAAIHGGITGNPYYQLTYNVPSPSFSSADIVTGIPYAFLSPFVATVFDAFFWSALFALLLCILMIRSGYSRLMIVMALLFLASSIFGYMIRVTNMQTVFPFFLLFFIVVVETMRRDRLKLMGKYEYLFLGFFAGLATYLHAFLFQVSAVSLVIGATLAFVLRRKRLMHSFLSSIATMILLAIPYFAYFYGMRDFPSFGDTMNLYLGVRSHFPSPGVYFYGRWLLLLFGWSLLLWIAYGYKRGEHTIVALNKKEPEIATEDVVFTVATLSLGVLGVMVQNVITGVDIAGPSHAKYFIDVLLPLGLMLFMRPTVKVLFMKGALVQKILLFFCLSTILVKVLLFIPTQFPPAFVYNPESAGPQVMKPAGSPQYIMPALSALRALPGAQVIAAPVPLNAYIPLYTGQHVLYDSNGGSFATSLIESADRSFTSYLGKELTRDEVAKAYDDIAPGTGSELLGRNKLARKLCASIFRTPSCTTLVVARYFSGDGIIDRPLWFDYYQTKVRPNVVLYLHRFHVSEVVIDRRLPLPEFLHMQTPWYSDQYYAIYDITAL